MDTGLIDLYTEEEFKEKLEQIKPRKEHEAWRNFCILLYYSGRRPIEILELTRKQVDKKGRFITILFRTFKGGRGSLTYYRVKKLPLMLEFWEWFKNFFPPERPFMVLGVTRRAKIRYKTKKGEEKEYPRTTANITHYFTQWFQVPPYFFRHNRTSAILEKGGTLQQAAHQRGTTVQSTERYAHLSERKAKEVSKFIED